MAVEVFVEGLRVLVVSGEGIDTVESSIQRIIVAGAEIVLLGIGVELFAGVKRYTI